MAFMNIFDVISVLVNILMLTDHMYCV
jgi:hypothetical protein